MSITITIAPQNVEHSYFNRKSNFDVKEIGFDNGNMWVTFHEAIGANRLFTRLKQTQTVIESDNIQFPKLTVDKKDKQINISGNTKDFSHIIKLLNQMKFISDNDRKNCDKELSTLLSAAATPQNKQ